MKYFFIVITIISVCFAEAQVINIPDPNFKRNLIEQGVDINHDGDIQLSEALQVVRINIYGSNTFGPVRDLTGIREFKNINFFSSVANKLGAIDLNGLLSLAEFHSTNDSLTSVDFSGCSSLTKIICPGNALTVLDVSGLSNIRYIDASQNQVAVFLHDAMDSLTTLDISGNSLTELDLRNCPNISDLRFNANSPLLSANLSGLNKILSLNNFSTIKSLDVSGCSNLVSIYLNGLSDINLTGCSNLNFLNIISDSIKRMDFSTCINLRSLYVVSHSLTYINLKNGSSLTGYDFDFDNAGSTTPINICVDGFEVDALRQYFNSTLAQPEVLNLNPYCSFNAGGNYNSTVGKVRLDANNNGCDDSDPVLRGIPIVATDSMGNHVVNFTNLAGEYSNDTYDGVFTIAPYFPYPYFTIDPASATVRFDTANSLIDTANFCVHLNGIHNNLELTFLPALPPARPGFDAAYRLIYKNRGTTTLSGNVVLNFDHNKMNFVAASENVSTQSSGQLLWNYNNLQPFESKTIMVTFNLLPAPVNNIGDTILYLAAITPSDNDETPFDNSFILPQKVVGSFDPNDKQCIEGSKLDISKIGDYLHYVIHFQNEGTDTAFNIVVADTLSDKLKWNSFEFIGSSHKADARLTNNIAEFFFENIHLPYKAIDEPGSNGWVAFKIKPKPSVVIGDSLNNSAAIYFDFNLPVITNTATTIVSSASTPVPVKLEYFSVNQKNNTNILNWKASCNYGNASFIIERSEDGIHFKAIGNLNATALRCQLPFNFTDNNPVAGKNYYRLKITDADGISFYSKTLVIGNSKAGIEITTIANNTVYLNSNKQQTIQLKVIAADGRAILNEKQQVAAGTNNITLQMKNLSKGIYTLVVYTNNGDTITNRFIR